MSGMQRVRQSVRGTAGRLWKRRRAAQPPMDAHVQVTRPQLMPGIVCTPVQPLGYFAVADLDHEHVCLPALSGFRCLRSVCPKSSEDLGPRVIRGQRTRKCDAWEFRVRGNSRDSHQTP
eukprot:7508304-Alexandrium_andersonii.AAC.1